MREQIQELYSKFSGQDVFIVGGGYSVKDINIEYLYDKKCICVNNSYEILPDTDAIFWGDSSWINLHLHKLNDHKCKLRFHPKAHGKNFIKDDIKTLGDSTVLLLTGDYGYDPNIDNVKGNNSGTQCLNFVINLKPKKIYLIGFDMRDNPLKRNQTHYHDDNPATIRHDTYSRLFIPSMNALNRDIRKLNIPIDIINCSKTSALTCFRKELISGLNR